MLSCPRRLSAGCRLPVGFLYVKCPPFLLSFFFFAILAFPVAWMGVLSLLMSYRHGYPSTGDSIPRRLPSPRCRSKRRFTTSSMNLGVYRVGTSCGSFFSRIGIIFGGWGCVFLRLEKMIRLVGMVGVGMR